jgi:hypothetical protein
MPFFEEFYANKLRGSLGLADADSVLDLVGASREEAERAIRELIERSRFGPRATVAVRLANPPPGGGETLFQPVGRLLLDARKRGWVEHLHTLPAQDGLGFYAALAGRPGAPSASA